MGEPARVLPESTQGSAALVEVRQRKRKVDSGNFLRPTYYFLKGAKKLWLCFWYRRVKRLLGRGRG